jgi:ribosomal protein S18 acetylase RimI-like enzyme
MMSSVIEAEASDLNPLSELLADAFVDLPPASWLIGDETARRKIFPAYFRIHLEHALEHGLVYTTPDWAGVAVWLPVGVEPPTPPDGYEGRLAAVTAPWTGQFIAFDAAVAGRHPAGKEHHHLALLGVGRGRQRRGIGSMLLQAHHKRLDQDGLPAYLEASSRDNRKLYLRHWYVDLGPPINLPDGPSLFPMWREPQGRKPTGKRGNKRGSLNRTDLAQDEDAMAWALRPPHVIEPSCPLTCMERELPAKVYQAVRRHLHGEHHHPTVGHVVALHHQFDLKGIRRLGAQGRELTTMFLESRGLIHPRPDHTERQSTLESMNRLGP